MVTGTPPGKSSGMHVSSCLSSICYEPMFVVGRALCYPLRPANATGGAMQILRQEVAADRRVSLIEHYGWFAVRIEVRRPAG